MKKLKAKSPIIYVILIAILGFLMCIPFILAGTILSVDSTLATAFARIIAGVILFFIFFREFNLGKSFRGLIFMLPVLVIAVFNIINHFATGGGSLVFNGGAVLILAIAPAIFEEVIFRGIAIPALFNKYKNPTAVICISAVIFCLFHLTNLVGAAPLAVLVQLAYSLVIGLVLGAVYVRSGDLLSVIIAHALIDLTSNVFPGTSSTPIWVLVVFAVMLAGEAVYAFILGKKGECDK